MSIARTSQRWYELNAIRELRTRLAEETWPGACYRLLPLRKLPELTDKLVMYNGLDWDSSNKPTVILYTVDEKTGHSLKAYRIGLRRFLRSIEGLQPIIRPGSEVV